MWKQENGIDDSVLGRNTDADIENRYVDTSGEWEYWMHWEIRIDIYTLPCVTQIVSGNLLYNTGSSVLRSVIT